MSKYGYMEGDICLRSGCKGMVKEHPIENCSCHISPPCGACTSPRCYCETCGWEESEDEVVNDYVVSLNKETGSYRSWELRPLNPNKLDWHSKPHTGASMIKEGVYPEGMTWQEVERKVVGTFGGRFAYFGDGKFKYIAYTD
ncbi:hypothetical protein [Morganella morganii]|uniref:hypothetical protein n=1 Tax=Morganella morganii TaxID=582 RepID=UPI0014192187|nr:hypothetical protein [Morganella morganii]NIH18373.1 hypothetical protein [Morganella morganii]